MGILQMEVNNHEETMFTTNPVKNSKYARTYLYFWELNTFKLIYWTAVLGTYITCSRQSPPPPPLLSEQVCEANEEKFDVYNQNTI